MSHIELYPNAKKKQLCRQWHPLSITTINSAICELDLNKEMF